MKLSILVIAFQGVRSHPLRSALAIVSLGIGVVGVVTMAAAASTVADSIQQKALMAGGPVATFEVTVEAKGRFVPDLLTAVANDLQQQDPSIRVSRGGTADGLTALIDGEPTSAEVSFIEAGLREIRPMVLTSGSWIDDQPRLVPFAVVNRALVLHGTGLGEHALLSGADHTPLPVAVVGTVDDGTTTPRMYISIASARDWVAIRGASFHESLTVSAPGLTPEATRARLNELSAMTDVPAAWAVRRTDTLSDFADSLRATRSSFAIVGYLGLLTAIIAIGNLGLSTVRERAAELSVRRALGAGSSDILLIMLVESGIMGVLAGLLAIPSSMLLYSTIGNAFNAPFGVALPPYPLEYAVVGFAVGLGASLLAGAVPAIRSATLPIATFSRE